MLFHEVEDRVCSAKEFTDWRILKMAKNIEMNIKTESGYEVLYPSVMAENIIIENTTYGSELN